ncbi:MAG TPA: SDR family oxidoreductase [Bacteroidales bacterium]|nr:SDR family oxidoreductase [Bacteroidales bacterium]
MNRKVALITGASSGIGRELALIHADKGDDLVLVARSIQKMQELKDEIKSKKDIDIIIIGKDLSEKGAASDVFKVLQEKNVVPDYLINNAGFGDFSLFAESDWNKQEQMINVNITALSHLTRLIIPLMIQRGSGKILNVASLASFQPGPTMSVYFASKAYVLSFSQALHNELKEHGITVTALCPGSTDTLFHAVTMGDPSLLKERKMDSPRDVALFGYDAMIKGKPVVIYGFKNKLVVFLSRFLTREFIASKARKIQESKHI